MPGVPKSAGCQTCKQRRIKCDETWPSCAHCRHTGSQCPGPTSLIKFINNGLHTTSKGKETLREAQRAKISQTGPALRMSKVQYAKVGDKDAKYGILKISNGPRSNPTTLADRISLRLVNNMGRGQQGVASLYMTYLPELPKRLSNSPCLRDLADLFCSAWSDFRRREYKHGGLMAMPQYGKALRSLGRALLNKHGRDPETLASMVLLERTSNLFERGPHKKGMHLKAIREMFMKKGPPNLTDDLDIATTNEVHWLLLRDDSRSEDNSFIYTPPWKEALQYCADQNISFTDVRHLLVDDVWVLYGCSKQFYPLLPKFQRVCHDSSEEAAADALSLRHQLQSMRDMMRDKPIKSWQKALEEGAITETSDTKSITGQKYVFNSVFLASMYQKILLIRLATLRMLSELTVIWGPPDTTLSDECREVSVYIWKMIPYICSLEAVIAMDMVKPIFFSYESANQEEKEYLLDSIQHIDRHIEDHPQDRKSLAKVLGSGSQLFAYFADSI